MNSEIGVARALSRRSKIATLLALHCIWLAGCQNYEAANSVGPAPLASAAPTASVPGQSQLPSPTPVADPPTSSIRGRTATRAAGPDTPAAPPARSQPAKEAKSSSEPTKPVQMVNAVPATAAKRVAILQPAERHVLGFQQASIRVFDRPYGSMKLTLSEKDFPRQQTTSGQTGVPIYAHETHYVKLPLPDGDTGWVVIDDVRMSTVPCSGDDGSTRRAPGPIGAGSSVVDCGNRKR